jgi:hypothetical protein
MTHSGLLARIKKDWPAEFAITAPDQNLNDSERPWETNGTG